MAIFFIRRYHPHNGELKEIKHEKKHNRITKELLEIAKGMHKIGILDDKAYEKITTSHLAKKNFSKWHPSQAMILDLVQMLEFPGYVLMS